MRVILDAVGHQFAGAAPLFQNVTATLEGEEIVGVVGPSGSGKSTLLAIIAGWLKPTAGVVRGAEQARFAWAFQNPIGSARRTAIDHVVLPLIARGQSREEAESRASTLLDSFGLGQVGGRPFSALSGGEAQRLMLARATASSPDIMLVDEPTAQLDPSSASSVVDVLGHLASTGSLVIIATHDPKVRARCTRLVELGAVQ